ncbi:hypothetical protein DFH28DRAFT_557726 [Melampsora americana]|nr:hypothetical protein DFH28DRAFT_557726 [Melampsora americana]
MILDYLLIRFQLFLLLCSNRSQSFYLTSPPFLFFSHLSFNSKSPSTLDLNLLSPLLTSFPFFFLLYTLGSQPLDLDSISIRSVPLSSNTAFVSTFLILDLIVILPFIFCCSFIGFLRPIFHASTFPIQSLWSLSLYSTYVNCFFLRFDRSISSSLCLLML